MERKPGRPRRNAEDNRKIRAEIATHALRLFREEGVAAVSMRRLAKEAGCAPMTLYAHFEGKIDVLQYLWADVLDRVFQQIADEIAMHTVPVGRLRAASVTFVQYWLTHPDHFRLVFMSNEVSRSDVKDFLTQGATRAGFSVFAELAGDALTDASDAKTKTDALMAALIGIALCANTIKDYGWAEPDQMVDRLIADMFGA